MAWVFLLIFVGIPLMELSVLIEVGSDIGAFSTILLCLLTAAVGLSLIRMQGLKVIADLQNASQDGQPLVEPLVHGFFLLVAGVCLLFPGFVTDAIGGLLLIPPVRLALGRAGLAGAAARGSKNFYYSHRNNSGRATIIIDGDFTETDPGEGQKIATGQNDNNALEPESRENSQNEPSNAKKEP